MDGAVIIVEAVLHRLQHLKVYQSQNISQTMMDDEVYTSSSKMMNSAVFGQIIILIVYLPILTLEGVEGKMFIRRNCNFCIIGSIYSFFNLYPMMSSLVLSKKIDDKKTISDKMIEKIEKIHINH
ncbi:MAG: efflux RND transporter permease subunit [Cloacibacterium normanense]